MRQPRAAAAAPTRGLPAAVAIALIVLVLEVLVGLVLVEWDAPFR